MKTSLLCAAIAAIVAMAPPASAQYASLDRQDDSSRIGFQLDVSPVSDSDVTFLRTELYGQYSIRGLGGYLMIPLSHALVSGDDDETAMGNAEIGGLFHQQWSAAEITFRLGLSLPTAASEDFNELVTNLLATFGRVTDLVNTLPDTFALRLGVSPGFETGILFGKLDVGFDLAIPAGDARDDLDLFVRGNVGVGVKAGLARVAVELVNVGLLTAEDGDASDNFFHTVGLSVLFDLPTIQPYAAVVLPLDDDINEDLAYVLTFGVAALL